MEKEGQGQFKCINSPMRPSVSPLAEFHKLCDYLVSVRMILCVRFQVNVGNKRSIIQIREEPVLMVTSRVLPAFR